VISTHTALTRNDGMAAPGLDAISLAEGLDNATPTLFRTFAWANL